LIKIVNQTVPLALDVMGYSVQERDGILAYLDREETIEGAPGLKPEHVAVFDCAFKARKGTRTIAPMGHVRMMGATQAFLSGAISKTVNMPSNATPDEIADVYIQAWQLGLKAIAIYRDGCKRTQPLNTGRDELKADKAVETVIEKVIEYRPVRRKLPAERTARTHKFSVGGHDGYITVGLYDDGTPGEIFLTMAKEGSTVSGLMDAFATSVSMALQYGVPVQVLCDKFSHMRFEPAGYTGNEEIPFAKSLMDYIFRWMDLRYGEGAQQKQEALPFAEVASTAPANATTAEVTGSGDSSAKSHEREVFTTQADAPPCHVCGSIMVRSGACYKCFNCGATSGCS